MIYILLSVVNLIGKTFLFKQLLKTYNKSQLHRLMYALFCILFIQSFLEFSLYYYADEPETTTAYWCLIGAYVCLFSWSALLPFIAVTISNASFPHTIFYSFISLIAAIIALLLFSNKIVAGVQFIETTQSLTRIEGPYYFIFQLTVLLCMLATLAILIKNFYATNYFIRVRCKNLLLAFIPFLISTVSIISLMEIGVEINAVGTAPLIGLLYIAAIVHNLQPDKQPDYSTFLPFTPKNKMLMSSINQLVYMQPGINKKTLNEQLVDYYLCQPGLTQKEVSAILNVSEATLSRRKKQLKSQADKSV